MTHEVPSILSHVSVGTDNFAAAVKFYDKVLLSLGIKQLMQHPGAAAYGKQYPEFWVQTPIDGKPASVGNGSHFSFIAINKEEVNLFYQTALEAGATCDGEPGPRKEYGEPYYGCFLRDLDGHKIEATFWDMELAQKLG